MLHLRALKVVQIQPFIGLRKRVLLVGVSWSLHMGMLAMDVKKILIVEDEPMLRELLSMLIEDFGADAMAVETADQGISMLAESGWTGMITDVRTPGSADGWDLAWAAYDRWPGLSIIVTSGGNNHFERPLPPSASFLSKPWSLEQLSELMRRSFGCVKP